MRIVVVNENDEIIGAKERDDKHQHDITRSAGAWVLNDNKEVLIAQRAVTKVHSPGKWGISCAGSVEEGDTYESCLLKELKEELGIEAGLSDLLPLSHTLKTTSHRYFCQMFVVRKNVPLSDIVVQRDEVEAVQWIAVPALSAWFAEKPSDFTASFGGDLKNLEEFVAKP